MSKRIFTTKWSLRFRLGSLGFRNHFVGCSHSQRSFCRDGVFWLGPALLRQVRGVPAARVPLYAKFRDLYRYIHQGILHGHQSSGEGPCLFPLEFRWRPWPAVYRWLWECPMLWLPFTSERTGPARLTDLFLAYSSAFSIFYLDAKRPPYMT